MVPELQEGGLALFVLGFFLQEKRVPLRVWAHLGIMCKFAQMHVHDRNNAFKYFTETKACFLLTAIKVFFNKP